MKTQILKAVLSHYGKSDQELFSSIEGVSADGFQKYLKAFDLLNYTQRYSFYWELQTEVEKCVYENIGVDDLERISDIIAEAWNQKKELKIDSSVVKNFLYTLNFKYPNSRKAFAYVCDGDLASYKAFNSKSKMFLDYLFRYVTCITENNRMLSVLRNVEEVMLRLFESNTRADNWDSLSRLSFQQKRRHLKTSKMSAYKRTIGAENLVFAEGMKTILLEVLHDQELTENLTDLKHKLQPPISKEEPKEEDSKIEDLLGSPTSEIITHISLEPKKETVSEITNKEDTPSSEENNETTSNKTTVPDEVDKLTEVRDSKANTEILSSLEEALSAVQTAIDKTTQLSAEQNMIPPNIQAGSDQRLAIAEEGITRLKSALAQEKEKVTLAEEKAYIKILQAIGGESSNYLLSDLFEESQGVIPDHRHISAGRLINLFSSLSLAIGLEEYHGGYELGDPFTISKEELIKNYHIDAPIESQKETIRVKLMKYGWSLNGKIVIQPLVTEVKEDL